MKKRFIVLFVMVIAVFVVAFSAYAENNIKIIVNGQEIVSEVQPFLKDDRTMVPLRVISEALGATVAWDQETQTVTITTDSDLSEQKPETPENDLTKDRLPLSELKPVNETAGMVFYQNWGDNPDGPRGVFSINGKRYFDGIGMLNYPDSKGNVMAEYQINGEYKKLTATVGASDIDATPNSGKTYLQIYGDDELLFTSKAFRYTDEPRDIDINITGVNVLRLVSYADKGVGVNDSVWANIMLHKEL